MSNSSEQLALHGGAPVRTHPLPSQSALSQLSEDTIDLVVKTLKSESLFRYYGPKLMGNVRLLEQELSRDFGQAHALALSSGTAALKTALAALGIGPGSEVIVPACTFVACAGAVVTSGAVPVFAECDKTLGLDPGRLSSALSPNTRAILVVHVKGVPARMDILRKFADANNLRIIEDASQAYGAEYAGQRIGSWGDVTTVSFQLNKTISSGEGGAALFSDDRLYARAIMYHDQGMLREFKMDSPPDAIVGENLRMSEISAAILLEQVRNSPAMFKDMRARKRRIRQAVSSLRGLQLRELTDESGDDGSALCMYLEKPGAARFFRKALNAENVTCENLAKYLTYFYSAVFSQRQAVDPGCSFNCPRNGRKVEYRRGMCPNTEQLLERAVCVPLSPALSDEDCGQIVTAISKVATHLSANYDTSFEERYRPSKV
ncbi:MAG: aminotransferase class I/II-fold pyridoxal phosphate-dependent enzyme [candidate division Zixibacteria bacterium]|nr:aminotransferase class I/II-fold pyridoxal phosphate-dependent enzyme [candidate division Zixibacteria bacterium]